MKIISLLVLIFLLSVVGNSQSNGIKPGKEYKVPRNSEEIVIGEHNEKIYSYTRLNTDRTSDQYIYHFSVFDKDLNRIEKVEIPFSNTERDIKKVFINEGKIWVISIYNKKLAQEVILYLDKIDLKTLEKENYTILERLSYGNGALQSFSLIKNGDNGTIAFMDFSSYKGEFRKFGLCYLDKDFNNISTHYFKLYNDKKEIDILPPYVLQSGKLLIPACKNIYADEKKKIGISVVPKAFLFDTINSVKELVMPQFDDMVMGVIIANNTNSTISCSAISEKRKSNEIDYVEVFNYNEYENLISKDSGNAESINLHQNTGTKLLSEFEETNEYILNSSYTYKGTAFIFKKNFQKRAPRRTYEKIYQLGSNSIYISQKFKKSFDAYKGMVNGSHSEIYLWRTTYTDLEVLSLDENGNLNWHQTLNKRRDLISRNEDDYLNMKDYTYKISGTRLYVLSRLDELSSIVTINIVTGAIDDRNYLLENNTSWKQDDVPAFWSKERRHIYTFQSNDNNRRRLIRKVY